MGGGQPRHLHKLAQSIMSPDHTTAVICLLDCLNHVFTAPVAAELVYNFWVNPVQVLTQSSDPLLGDLILDDLLAGSMVELCYISPRWAPSSTPSPATQTRHHSNSKPFVIPSPQTTCTYSSLVSEHCKSWHLFEHQLPDDHRACGLRQGHTNHHVSHHVHHHV